MEKIKKMVMISLLALILLAIGIDFYEAFNDSWIKGGILLGTTVGLYFLISWAFKPKDETDGNI